MVQVPPVAVAHATAVHVAVLFFSWGHDYTGRCNYAPPTFFHRDGPRLGVPPSLVRPVALCKSCSPCRPCRPFPRLRLVLVLVLVLVLGLVFGAVDLVVFGALLVFYLAPVFGAVDLVLVFGALLAFYSVLVVVGSFSFSSAWGSLG